MPVLKSVRWKSEHKIQEEMKAENNEPGIPVFINPAGSLGPTLQRDRGSRYLSHYPAVLFPPPRSPGLNGSDRLPSGWSYWPRQAITQRSSGCSRRLISTPRVWSPTWTQAQRSTCTAARAHRRPRCRGRWCPASSSTDSRAPASRPRRCPRWPASSHAPRSPGEAPAALPSARAQRPQGLDAKSTGAPTGLGRASSAPLRPCHLPGAHASPPRTSTLPVPAGPPRRS